MLVGSVVYSAYFSRKVAHWPVRARLIAVVFEYDLTTRRDRSRTYSKALFLRSVLCETVMVLFEYKERKK